MPAFRRSIESLAREFAVNLVAAVIGRPLQEVAAAVALRRPRKGGGAIAVPPAPRRRRAKVATPSPPARPARRARPPTPVAPAVVVVPEKVARASASRPVTRSLVGSVEHMRASLAELGADEEG